MGNAVRFMVSLKILTNVTFHPEKTAIAESSRAQCDERGLYFRGMSALEVLQKHWGYREFRPSQAEIIASVAAGKDTLALLPTGGGKSICFQVPALMQEGICIVVSPLIALMKDQVEQLTRRGIKAAAITSALSWPEMDAIFDNCIYGDVKFLYLSPERLKTELAVERVRRMKVNLFAVDEAHCISEWGYDFRPPYLEIAAIRELHPKVPVLALTASATPEVVDDIQEKLDFREKNVFFQSFERSNLAYFIDFDDNKLGKALRVMRKNPGTGIIYVRNRKATERLAKVLQSEGVSADFYHAGLPHGQREARQAAWISGQTRVIVATNAFGMGIDKPDVRFVVHLDLPDTLENYYQECGRGGRDGKKSFAIAILTAKDLLDLKAKHEKSFPSREEIKRSYQALASSLKIATGAGKDETYEVDFQLISKTYDIPVQTLFSSIRFLEKEGYLALSEFETFTSRLHLAATPETLYQYQLKNQKQGHILQVIMRSYTGLFDGYVAISESTVQRRAQATLKEVTNTLNALHQKELAVYVPATDKPRITFLTERISNKNLSISKEHYDLRKKVMQKKISSVLGYTLRQDRCRSRMLLEYFGETNTHECGQCDYCTHQKNLGKEKVHIQSGRLDHILASAKNEPEVIHELRKLLEAEKIVQQKDGKFVLVGQQEGND